jgi:hypothetical protein
MKQLIGIVIAMLLMTSQANGKENTTPTAIVAQQRIATPNVQAHAKNKRILKNKAHRVQLYGMDDNDDDFVQSEDVATGYRRRDLTKIEHPDGISERVRWRLFLARQLAMMKYRELHGYPIAS